MENNPIAFFFGSELKKLDTYTHAISPIDGFSFSVNRVYMVNEPVTLIAGDNDKTENLSLNQGDLFITLQRYNDDSNKWDYYRIPIHSKELTKLLTEWKKEYEESKNKQTTEVTDACCKAF